VDVADNTARTKRRDRAVIGGALATGGTRVVTAATSFVILAMAARTLTRDEFGFVTMLLSIWLILTMFDLGLGGALTTRVAASHAREDLAEVRAYVDHALLAMSALGGLIAVAGCIGAITLPWGPWIEGNLSPATVVRGLIITFVLAGASMPAAVGAVALSGLQRFNAATGSVAAGGLLAMGVSAAIAATVPSPEAFLAAVLGCPLLVSLGFTAWVRMVLLRTGATGGRFDRGRLASMLRSSAWYALYTTANTVALGTGTVVVGSVLGLTDAAIFNVAARLFSPIITVIAASGAMLWPGMTEAISRGEVSWARTRHRRGLVIIGAVSSVLSVALIAFGPWLAHLWVGAALVPSRSLLAWTAAFTVTLSVTSQASVVLMAVERLRGAATLAVGGALVSVAASVLLARTIGVNGAAIGALAGCLGVLLPGIALLGRDTLRSLQHAAAPTPEAVRNDPPTA
jgi:O-antigen/teichoic acid export membrane protein